MTLFVLHLLLYFRSHSDFVFNTSGLIKSLAKGSIGGVSNWKPSSELGVDRIKQFALNATTGEKLIPTNPFGALLDGKTKQSDPIQSMGDLLPFSSLIATCCGPFDEGYGPRRQCYRDDMPTKDSVCSPFYMGISATNYIALIVILILFWFIHALTSIKLIAHILPLKKSASAGQTYIVPEGRVKIFDKSDYTNTSSSNSRSVHQDQYQDNPV